LTVTQYSVLGHLVTFDGISIGELAEKLVMDPTTLTRNLRPLEREGLVAAMPDR
jgi:DNA-binding MarR family transcriptional regulator